MELISTPKVGMWGWGAPLEVVHGAVGFGEHGDRYSPLDMDSALTFSLGVMGCGVMQS